MKYHQTWAKNWDRTLDSYSMVRNIFNQVRWARTKVQQGYRVLTIGTVSGRSLWYRLEMTVMRKAG